MPQPQPAPAGKTRQYGGIRDSYSGEGGGGPNEPVFGGLALDHVKMKVQTRTVTLVLSGYLILITVLPPDSYELLEALGVQFAQVADYGDVVNITLAILLAHLSALLAQGARLARCLGTELEVSFDANEKVSMELLEGEGGN